MGAYQLVAVGTDGSESSFRAVDRAAAIATDAKARLLIICAYRPEANTAEAERALGEDAAFHVLGSTPAEETLKRAQERAATSGAVDVDTVAVRGEPIDSVVDTVVERQADLIVVGNRGLNSLAGRLLGSVPQGISRSAASDVLIVHTT